MAQSPNNLIWIDLEMTGLDPASDTVLEIATVITDSELNILEEGPVVAIHQPDEVLDAMDEWNTRQHGKSGLIDRVRNSKSSMSAAERATLAFVEQFVPARQSPMCGNSICQDRRFLARLMPELERHFHYRNLDVSTVKELARRWAPVVADAFSKDSRHEALADIHDSIRELRYYRDNLFRIP